ELEAFTCSVAHDLRAPLRHIQDFSATLAEDLGPDIAPAIQESLRDIVNSTQNMGRMVDDLLGLARIGGQGLSVEVTGLRALVEELLNGEILKQEIAERDIQWHIGDLPYVDCDAGLIKQVFFNLLSNAVKFTRPRPIAIIEVGQTMFEDQPTLYVRDNGVGF